MRKVIWLLTIPFGLIFVRPTLAQTDCPYGRINDPYPGHCSLYQDENQNQICDLSEPNRPLTGKSSSANANNVSFWFIFLPAALYFLHWFLVTQTDWGKKWTFFSLGGLKYFWNLVLLLLFLPAGIFGALLGLGVKSRFLLVWHNNLGMSFVVVGLIHLLAHLNYYLSGYRLLLGKVKKSN